MTMCTHSNEKAMGMVMMPTFTYKKGQLWMDDHFCIKSLVQRGCNVDKTWGLFFERKADPRDARPLLCDARFVFASHVEVHMRPWRASQLVVDGRAEAARQLTAPETELIEDLDAGALPTSYDDSAGGIHSGRNMSEHNGKTQHSKSSAS